VTSAGNHIKLATPTHKTTAPACTDNWYRQFPVRASAWLRDGDQFSFILINAAPPKPIFSGRRFAIFGKPP
jgi:hypothetical protein